MPLKFKNSLVMKCATRLLGAKIAILLSTTMSFAQDGGPTQPEAHSFEPIGTTQMVDLFTGDFTYNIPLFNIPGPDGGYPINLAYHSGIQMEQEATWVGLGWNINVGTINRQVRNLPDDFGGDGEDNITIQTDMRPNWTVGVGASQSTDNFELFGVGSVQGQVSISAAIYYNNYKGIGYTVSQGFDAKFGNSKTFSDGGKGIVGDIGFNLKLDSQEGISQNVSLGIGRHSENNGVWTGKFGVSTGFNSRTGWNRSLALSGAIQQNAGTRRKGEDAKSASSFKSGSSIGFNPSLVSMSVPQQMRGFNVNVSISGGIGSFGFFGKIPMNAYYNYATLKDRNQALSYTGVGYMYYQNTLDTDAANPLENDMRVKDVSRDGEQMVHKNSQRLGSPLLTYDVYSVTGQGIGNMFRPYRNDVGTIKEPRKKSEFHGGSAGLELGAGASIHAGLDLGYNYAHTKSDYWPSNYTNSADLLFKGSNSSWSNGVYFQNYGEHSVDNIAANYGTTIATDKPVVYGFSTGTNFYNIIDENHYKGGNSAIGISNTNNERTERKRRALGVEALTNRDILNMNQTATVVPEFDIRYYSSLSSSGYNNSSTSSYHGVRTSAGRGDSHVAGYMATNEGGLRYVYALPAYNNVEEDLAFSVTESTGLLTTSFVTVDGTGSNIDYSKQGTDAFYQSMKKSHYAHAYMLTAILGNDYVDIDNVPGPSDGDLGYWVKFTYARAKADMKWRAPYSNALYERGNEMSFKDGKGRFSKGEKEVWYLATAETKTHIAEFVMSSREDMFEPHSQLNGGISTTHGYSKLDRIDIYVKGMRYPNGTFDAGAKPLKSCHFVYDYSLCPGIPNNSGNADNYGEGAPITNAGGKLTLKKVYFTYNGNNIGSTSPYTFEYNTQVNSTTINYGRDNIDRWGNYQPNDYGSNLDYPYNSPYLDKTEMDERAALWSISSINLPSTGRLEIDYESDSYAYVQDEVAMHMYSIVSCDPYSSNSTGVKEIAHPKDAAVQHRNVYFKLEQPISTGLTQPERDEIIKKYINVGEYMYFKVKINMTKNPNSKEMVGGYAKVLGVGIDETSNVGGEYQWGFVQLDYLHVDGEATHFHPFTEVGARHIKYNNPDVLYDSPANASNSELSKSDIKAMSMSMLSNITDFKDLFSDFTRVLTGVDNDKRLDEIDLSRSYLRLRTPDKIKYGGGHRVKQITINDNWDLATTENASTYGVVYDYNIIEKGQTISSGVAAYEPMVGGDEIALRKPLPGWENEHILAKTMAQTYVEEPGNESLFPGPQIGYREVRSMSLVTNDKVNGVTNNAASYSGISISEFYTAKDYPIYQEISDLETNKTLRKSRLIIPALIVNIDRTRMAASQGYYIELNDMHGKSKGAREIGFTDAGAEVEISKVRYEYSDTDNFTKNDAGETLLTHRLNNTVPILYSDKMSGSPDADIQQGTIATEVEFIPEVRYKESKRINADLQINFEMLGFLPMFFPIPSYSQQVEKVGTVVTNKIVNKSGIVKEVWAEQRGSKAHTENLAFDQYTGAALLSKVNNDFDNDVFSYSIMAYDQYDGTGPAFKNIGVYELGTPVSASFVNNLQEITMDSDPGFVPGDVLMATPKLSGGILDDNTRPKLMCTVQRLNSSGDHVIETLTALSGLYHFKVIRSGRRNLLGAQISAIAALKDPTVDRDDITCVDRIGETTQTITVRSIDSVLAISASELGSNWYKDTRQLTDLPANWYDDRMYSKGMSGLYSGVRGYAYVDNRIQTETLGETTVDLELDGVMNDVVLFDWNHLLTTSEACKNKWVKTDQVTLFNPSSFGIESKNILGTYSSSLYGKSGTEPIAVAGNAKNTEIGVENFEEYANGTLAISDNATNNLNFYSSIDVTARKVEDRLDVYDGFGAYGYVQMDYSLLSQYSDFVVRFHFDGYNNEAQEELLRANVVLSNAGSGITLVQITNIADLNVPDFSNRKWRGELFATKTIPDYPLSLTNTGLLVTDEKAHTGEKCLALYNVLGCDFLQGRLTLNPGEKYQFSGWVSSPDNLYLQKNFENIFHTNMQLQFFDFSGTLLNTVTLNERDILRGGFIDDWQKFTVDFIMPTGAHYVSVKLPTIHEVYSAEIEEYTQAAFYDDLRFQPLDGGMQTYVYNQENQRLEATLDGNNYATFYYYDDEGNLFLVKRETEQGIITVQESRSYVKRN